MLAARSAGRLALSATVAERFIAGRAVSRVGPGAGKPFAVSRCAIIGRVIGVIAPGAVTSAGSVGRTGAVYRLRTVMRPRFVTACSFVTWLVAVSGRGQVAGRLAVVIATIRTGAWERGGG